MVSIDLQQNVDTSNIDYPIGTTGNVNIPISIRNITSNATLRIKISFNEQLFFINTSNSFELAAQETQTVTMQLKKPTLDVLNIDTETTVQFEVENISDNTLTVKDPNTLQFNVRLLEETISVTD
jgi:hypothetical protein